MKKHSDSDEKILLIENNEFKCSKIEHNNYNKFHIKNTNMNLLDIMKWTKIMWNSSYGSTFIFENSIISLVTYIKGNIDLTIKDIEITDNFTFSHLLKIGNKINLINSNILNFDSIKDKTDLIIKQDHYFFEDRKYDNNIKICKNLHLDNYNINLSSNFISLVKNKSIENIFIENKQYNIDNINSLFRKQKVKKLLE